MNIGKIFIDMDKRNDNSDINKVLNEIIDVLDRTYFIAERKVIPNRFQKWISKVFLGVEWKGNIRPQEPTTQIDNRFNLTKKEKELFDKSGSKEIRFSFGSGIGVGVGYLDADGKWVDITDYEKW